MRQIGTLPDESSARRFSDYLLTEGIQASIEEGNYGWLVWVYDEDTLEKAREELAAFIADPQGAKYQQANHAAAEIRDRSVNEAIKARRRVVNVREEWRKPVTSRCPVTIGLLMFCVLITAGTKFGSLKEPLTERVLMAPITIRNGLPEMSLMNGLRNGEVWRLVSPIFMHMNFLHILFNGMWLYQLGTAVEMRRGSLRFALFVLFTAVASNLGQYYWKAWSPIWHPPIFGGMSGVVYGLFGYVWMKSRHDPNAGFYMPPNTVVTMVGWFFFCMTPWIDFVANAAHGVGLIVGIVVGYAGPMWRKFIRGT